MNLSAEIDRMFSDPNRDEHRFWTLIQSYVERVGSKLVSQDDIALLVQNVLIVISNGMSKFKVRHDHDVGGHNRSFTIWICVIVKTEANSMLSKKSYQFKRDLDFDRLGQRNDDGEWTPFDIPDPRWSDTESEEDKQAKADEVSRRLDSFRPLLNDEDKRLFDMLQGGLRPNCRRQSYRSPVQRSRTAAG